MHDLGGGTGTSPGESRTPWMAALTLANRLQHVLVADHSNDQVFQIACSIHEGHITLTCLLACDISYSQDDISNLFRQCP